VIARNILRKISHAVLWLCPSFFLGSIMATPQNQRYREFVDRFELVARTNLETTEHVADLCYMAGFNQRTLSRAFRAVHGTTPYRYLRELRLSEVKRVLSSEQGTVTQAAMRFGFREFGRFAKQYRKVFGESPSETKRRARLPHAESHGSASWRARHRRQYAES
jgi:transcriptional regulator GlxA family with amidase domain